MATSWDGAAIGNAPQNGYEDSVDTTGVAVTMPGATEAAILTLSAAGFYKRGAIAGTGVWISVPANTPRTIYFPGTQISVKATTGTLSYYIEALSGRNVRGVE